MGPTLVTGLEVVEGTKAVAIKLINVPPSCIDVPLLTPCANDSAIDPALFWCMWQGSVGSYSSGPHHAVAEPFYIDGHLVSLRVMLYCPVLSLQRLSALSGYAGDGLAVQFELGVSHGTSADGAKALPWVGMPDANQIRFSGLPEPPSPPPATPPGLPPRSPTTDRSCKELMDAGYNRGDGLYQITPVAGQSPVTVECDMTRQGGGWTLGVKHWYQSGLESQGASAYGDVKDALTKKGTPYKLSDEHIQGIIGEDNYFDILFDQKGYNNAYSSGNKECVRCEWGA